MRQMKVHLTQSWPSYAATGKIIWAEHIKTLRSKILVGDPSDVWFPNLIRYFCIHVL